MSSISAQGVVERASAELSKRINGLGLRSKHHHNNGTSGSNKTSVMERVTNVLCGGSSSHNNVNNAPEKPSRLTGKQQQQINKITGGGSVIGPSIGSGLGSNNSTPTLIRKISHPQNHIGGGYLKQQQQQQQAHHQQMQAYVPPPPITLDQLFQDERFLNKFFLYFNSYERRTLAQVCTRWRDLLYRCPRYWAGLYPILQCRELRQTSNQDRVRLYNSLVRRGFHSVCLFGATDEDALDLVHSFPLASKHVHSLSLRCSSISDRGLEALLDHLQVSQS